MVILEKIEQGMNDGMKERQQEGGNILDLAWGQLILDSRRRRGALDTEVFFVIDFTLVQRSQLGEKCKEINSLMKVYSHQPCEKPLMEKVFGKSGQDEAQEKL